MGGRTGQKTRTQVRADLIQEADPRRQAGQARRQCTAMSKISGKRCGATPIRGGSVCRMHGGSAPQVKRAARLRLAELIDPSIAVLRQRLEDDAHGQALGAAKDVLDRVGLKGADALAIGIASGGQRSIDPEVLKGMSSEDIALAKLVIGRLMGLEPEDVDLGPEH